MQFSNWTEIFDKWWWWHHSVDCTTLWLKRRHKREEIWKMSTIYLQFSSFFLNGMRGAYDEDHHHSIQCNFQVINSSSERDHRRSKYLCVPRGRAHWGGEWRQKDCIFTGGKETQNWSSSFAAWFQRGKSRQSASASREIQFSTFIYSSSTRVGRCTL